MYHSRAIRRLCLVLTSHFVVAPLAEAQQETTSKAAIVPAAGTTTTGKAASAGTAPAPSATGTAVAPTTGTSPQNAQGVFLSAVLNTNSDQGDYIPCEFPLNQLLNLRPSPIVDNLTSFETEAVKQAVISAGLSQTASTSFSDGSGLTFSQAIAGLTSTGEPGVKPWLA
jgi:hypothetical protein